MANTQERFFIVINSRGHFTGDFAMSEERLKSEFLFYKKGFRDWQEAEEYGYKIVELEIKWEKK